MTKKIEENIMQALEQEPMTSEEAVATAVNTLSKTENEKLFTEITDNEGKMLTALTVISEEFKVPVLQSLAVKFAQWRVSKQRKGRGEILSIARSVQEEKVKESRFRRVLGLGRI